MNEQLSRHDVPTHAGSGRTFPLAPWLPILLACALSACGDPRDRFTGRYNATRTLTLTGASSSVGQTHTGLSLAVTSTPGSRDGLDLSGDLLCGLTAKLGADPAKLDIILPQTCPTLRLNDACTGTPSYSRGSAERHWDDEDAPLFLNLEGTLAIRCSDGASGTVAIWESYRAILVSQE